MAPPMASLAGGYCNRWRLSRYEHYLDGKSQLSSGCWIYCCSTTESSVQNPINENDVWTLSWIGNIPQSIANNFADNDTLLIPVTVKTRNSSDVVVHSDEQRISLKVEPRPVISNVQFKHNNNNINTLVPGMTGVTIVANVNTVNALNSTSSFTLVTTGLTGGSFSIGAPIITGTAPNYTLTWSDVAIPNWTFTPVTDYSKEINFRLTATTINGSISTIDHEMVLLKNATFALRGRGTAQAAYTGIDPEGWFAPNTMFRLLIPLFLLPM
jgi:hypothetical protein